MPGFAPADLFTELIPYVTTKLPRVCKELDDLFSEDLVDSDTTLSIGDFFDAYEERHRLYSDSCSRKDHLTMEFVRIMRYLRALMLCTGSRRMEFLCAMSNDAETQLRKIEQEMYDWFHLRHREFGDDHGHIMPKIGNVGGVIEIFQKHDRELINREMCL